MEEGKAMRGRARGRARDVGGSPPQPGEGSLSRLEVARREMEHRKMFGGEGDSDTQTCSSSTDTTSTSSRSGIRGIVVPMKQEFNPRDEVQFDRDYVVTRPAGLDKKGKSGDACKVIANYYELRTHPLFCMSLYAVKIDPQPDEEAVIRDLVSQKKTEIGPYLLSGFQLFTTLKVKPEVVNYKGTVRGTEYKVVLEFKRVVAESEPLALQFANVLVREMQRALGFELMGRHYFDPRQKVPYQSWKVELWPGFQNSIRQQETSLMLNVESVWKVAQTENILQKIQAIRLQHGDGLEFQNRVNKELSGMVVITKYNNKLYKITKVDFDITLKSTFSTKKKLADGSETEVEITYLDYYRQRYKDVEHQITKEDQPVLISALTEKDKRRGMKMDIHLVPELCYPCGMNDSIRSNFRMMKDLSPNLHMDANRRTEIMNKFIEAVTANEQLKISMKDWGVKIKSEPVQVSGRFLQAEDIIAGNGDKLKPDIRADWTNGLKNFQMLVSMKLTKWAIVVTNRDNKSVGNLVSTMIRCGNQLGYSIDQPHIHLINDNRSDTYVKGIHEAIRNKGPLDMIFVVLSNNGLETYSRVKQVCSKELGVPSQCFLAKNLGASGLMSICNKLVIQMNAKQGGVPWGVSNPLKTSMILGYDDYPVGGTRIGAMTATMSPSLGEYYSTIQKKRADKRDIVAAMFEECLRAFAKRNQRLPERLMMYRNGVDEGQLGDVHKNELSAVKKQIKDVYDEFDAPPPKLSYIIVNKRINTRFFQAQAFSSKPKFSNPKPGLVVDDVVTRPERYDFFLVSQTARQGCVGVTYYNVIHDESELDPDKIQKFTYKLCHLYFNWSGTIAVPGPCQNAQKLAFQAANAIKGEVNSNLNYLLHYL